MMAEVAAERMKLWRDNLSTAIGEAGAQLKTVRLFLIVNA